MSRRNSELRPKWSEIDDNVLLEKVKENPSNLKAAFIATSAIIGRTPSACATRWYNHVSKEPNKTNTCFVTVSKKAYGRNRKNCKNEFTHAQKSKWRRILEILFS